MILALAGLGQLVDVDGRVIEVALGQRSSPWLGAAGIDHIRHQHDVVVGLDLDAALREYLPGEFQVVADLEHAPVSSSGFERVERGGFGDLIGRDIAAEQAGALAALAMRQRHVAGLVRRDSASAMPHSSACIGSRLVVARCRCATMPRSRARAIQA